MFIEYPVEKRPTMDYDPDVAHCHDIHGDYACCREAGHRGSHDAGKAQGNAVVVQASWTYM